MMRKKRITFVTKLSNSEISASLILRPGAVAVHPDLDPRVDRPEAAEAVDAVVPVGRAVGDVAALTAAAPAVVVAPAVAPVVLDERAVDGRPAVDADARDPGVTPAPVDAVVERPDPVAEDVARDVAGDLHGVAPGARAAVGPSRR